MQFNGTETAARRGASRMVWPIVLGLVAMAVGSVLLRDRPVVVQTDAVVQIDLDDLRYSFQPITGDEALFDLERDPDCVVNVAETRVDDVIRLRRRLLDELGAADLAALREPHAEAIERLRSLGYL